MNNLKYIVTKDKGLIGQYTSLVEKLYLRDLDVPSYNIKVDELIDNDCVTILAVTDENIVCAGGTLYFKNANKTGVLPCEKDTGINLFSIKESSNSDIISETSKVVIIDECRKNSSHILYNLYSIIIREASNRGVRSIYTVSYQLFNRLTKKVLNKLGFNYILLSEVNIPSAPVYNGIKMQLSMVDLSNLDSSVKEVV